MDVGSSQYLQPRTRCLPDGNSIKSVLTGGALAVSQRSSFLQVLLFTFHQAVPCCQSALRIRCFLLSLNCQANLNYLA